MGFFTKIKNWFKGDGFKEDEEIARLREEQTKEPEPIPRRQAKSEEQIRQEAKEEILKELEEKEEAVSDEIKEQLSSIPPEYQTDEARKITQMLPTSLQYPTVGINRKTEAEINKYVADSLSKIQSSPNWTMSMTANGMPLGDTLYEAVMNAVRDGGARFDEQVASLIAANPELFKYRFDTLATIHTDQGDIEMTLIGSIITDVEGYLAEKLENVETISISDNLKMLGEIQKEAVERKIALGKTSLNLENFTQTADEARIMGVTCKARFR